MIESNNLDGSNYVNWKFKVQTSLKATMAWNIVTGVEDKPACLLTQFKIGNVTKTKQRCFLGRL